MKSTNDRIFMHKPLRDILLNREELVTHAQDIARSHAQVGKTRERHSLIPHVVDNIEFLVHAQSYINGYAKDTRDGVPAAEWFLDNYYLLKDLRQEIKRHLPPKYERLLPKLSQGAFKVIPGCLP